MIKTITNLLRKGLYLFFLTIIFIGCSSNSAAKNTVQTAMDGTCINDIIASEIEKINQLKDTDILKALWKSYLISDSKSIETCLQLAVTKFQDFFNAKEYYDAYQYYTSIQALNNLGYFTDLDISFDELLNFFYNEIPAFSNIEENLALAPKSIENCINATVTVWVDKGLKIENGAGYADVVIGSGFFIDKKGYIVTNHHVINDLVDPKYEGYSRLYVKLASDIDTKIPAKLIGYDPILDLALLKVEIEPPFVLSLGSSSELSIGDKISAIGTPIGLEGTLTSGIISSVDRKLTTMGNVFQLDAAVNSGNSGGPLIDINHKVQAIVFAGMLRYPGLNFAIPVEYLTTELPFLYEGGELLHSWICAYGHTKRNGRDKVGLEVQYVMSGGCAEQSFLQEDDIIIEIQGENVNSLEDFHNILMKYQPGSLVSCKYIHGDEERTTLLYLEKRPKLPGKLIYNTDLISTAFIPLYGMKLIPSSTINSKSYRIEKVIKGSSAEEFGFSENDQVTVREVKIEKDADFAIAQIYTKRRKKGFLDVTVMMGASLDSPYYF